MNADGRLARYLRARREQLRPADVGLAVDEGVRRVVGLRREEVAVLAGISTAYYLRLEQGRDGNPSGQVLDALARALRLDPAATAHLHGLAGLREAPVVVDPGDVVHESTRWLIDLWPVTSAVVHNRYMDVLASNAMARALNPNYRPGVNSVLSLFTHPSEQVFHVEWEGLAARSVALLHTMADTRAGDTRLAELVAEGTASSALFRQFWARRDVWVSGHGTHELRHPMVGDLVLGYQRLPLIGTDGQSLFLYFAEPGTPSAAAMRLLAGDGTGGDVGQVGRVSPAGTPTDRPEHARQV
ncbi:helix-turn-helix transcriptional regulator [Promicromonospora sukumoe]|uniref:Transcriptional regulator with XRE-family HTH domain n=1 Tax=Promicromonospora sukumoe TaxID=88382 RepID=A0A7W3J8Z1_9MICO|nr:helix-turn-helix transcriptional regulator [Promicromonospora sukumoe]MBA8808456.1 transcriptional regulator with XRE-family HTH domain [Promicromonospora sukumoe]